MSEANSSNNLPRRDRSQAAGGGTALTQALAAEAKSVDGCGTSDDEKGSPSRSTHGTPRAHRNATGQSRSTGAPVDTSKRGPKYVIDYKAEMQEVALLGGEDNYYFSDSDSDGVDRGAAQSVERRALALSKIVEVPGEDGNDLDRTLDRWWQNNSKSGDGHEHFKQSEKSQNVTTRKKSQARVKGTSRGDSNGAVGQVKPRRHVSQPTNKNVMLGMEEKRSKVEVEGASPNDYYDFDAAFAGDNDNDDIAAEVVEEEEDFLFQRGNGAAGAGAGAKASDSDSDSDASEVEDENEIIVDREAVVDSRAGGEGLRVGRHADSVSHGALVGARVDGIGTGSGGEDGEVAGLQCMLAQALMVGDDDVADEDGPLVVQNAPAFL